MNVVRAALLILAVLSPQTQAPTLDQVLDALQSVETGGEPHGGRGAIGDGGRAIGPFQIHRAYWIDSGVPGRFEDCVDPQYARRVVDAYWTRWCPTALRTIDAETLARIHNGGPRGPRKASTRAYWMKVQAVLRSLPTRSRDAAGGHFAEQAFFRYIDEVERVERVPPVVAVALHEPLGDAAPAHRETGMRPRALHAVDVDRGFLVFDLMLGLAALLAALVTLRAIAANTGRIRGRSRSSTIRAEPAPPAQGLDRKRGRLATAPCAVEELLRPRIRTITSGPRLPYPRTS